MQGDTVPILDPFFYQIAFAPEPQAARTIAIALVPGDTRQTARAILTIATLSAFWLMVYMAPEIRRSKHLNNKQI
jgi:hypothetical protein